MRTKTILSVFVILFTTLLHPALSKGGNPVYSKDGNSICSYSYPSVELTNATVGTLTVTVTPTNVICNGANNGSATVAATGGETPYTYSWSTGATTSSISNLSAGTYTITVRSASLGIDQPSIGTPEGLSATASVIITQPNTLSASTSVLSNSCYGSSNGSASVTPSGGSSPYTYSWFNGSTASSISGLSAGAYSVTIQDACGSSATASVTIAQPANPLAITIATHTDASCGGTGSATANVVTGGYVPYTDLLDFNGTNGADPLASFILSGTTLYGMTYLGGAYSDGCIFSFNTNGNVYSDLLDFNGTNGKNPNGSLILSGTTLYGMTYVGGVYNEGCVFSFNTNGNVYTDLLDFNGTNGAYPAGDLILSGTTLYGMTSYGGANNEGCVFSFNTNGNLYTDLLDFNGTNGEYPTGSLTLSGTTLYGMVDGGGANDGGCVFSFNTIGNVYTDLYDFNGINRANPFGSLILSGTTLYGMTTDGGADSIGFVFSFNTNGNVYTDLLDFNGTNGAYPSGDLILSGTTLYGMTYGGGTLNNGCVFSFNTSGNVYTDLYDFNGTNGANPLGSLVLSGTTLYGMTQQGGTDSDGVVFSLNSPYSYNWTPNGGTNLTASNLSTGTYTVTVTDGNGCTATASANITQPNTLRDSIVTASVVNATCGNTGSATVGVQYGTSPYTYSWSGGGNSSTANGLGGGTYTVTVTDNCGTSATAPVTITQPNPLSTTATVLFNACHSINNGTAMANPSGGVSPYTYSWSKGEGTNSATSELSAGSYTVTVTDNCGSSATASVIIKQNPALSAAAAFAGGSVLCNGGSTGQAKVSVTGGSSPYIYSWSPVGGSTYIANGLSAGTYTVTVTDYCGASVTSSTTITQPALLRDSVATIGYPACVGGTGSAIIGVTGGTSPYIYTWSPNVSSTASATGLTIRGYVVQVKDKNGCWNDIDFSISQPPALRDSIIKLATVNVSCNGTSNGSAMAGVKYGITPYTYSWSPGGGNSATASGLSAGTYTVTVNDEGGCTVTASVNITQPSVLSPTAFMGANISCNGGSTGTAKVSVSGGTAPYTYSWSPLAGSTYIASGLSMGTYTVTVSDKCGASATSSTVVTQPAALRDSVITSSIISPPCSGGGTGSATIGVTGGTSPYRYTWSPNVSTTASATGLVVRSYVVQVKDNNGCYNDISFNVTCSSTSSVSYKANEVSCCPASDNINLYPNPNTGQFTLSGLQNGMILEMYDYTGKMISTMTTTNESMQLNIFNQANGVYLIRILDKDGNLISEKKVVKTQ